MKNVYSIIIGVILIMLMVSSMAFTYYVCGLKGFLFDKNILLAWYLGYCQ